MAVEQYQPMLGEGSCFYPHDGLSPHVPVIAARHWREIVRKPEFRLGLRALSGGAAPHWDGSPSDVLRFSETEIADMFGRFDWTATGGVPGWRRLYRGGGRRGGVRWGLAVQPLAPGRRVPAR